MADADDVRRLALALPHVEEIDCDGFDFRVGGKGFVWSYPERLPGQPRRIRTDVAVLYVGDEAEKQALLLGEPALFFTAPEYGGWLLVLVRLAEVDRDRLAELVTDAWRMRAPAPLAAEFDPAGLVKRVKPWLPGGASRARRPACPAPARADSARIASGAFRSGLPRVSQRRPSRPGGLAGPCQAGMGSTSDISGKLPFPWKLCIVWKHFVQWK